MEILDVKSYHSQLTPNLARIAQLPPIVPSPCYQSQVSEWVGNVNLAYVPKKLLLWQFFVGYLSASPIGYVGIKDPIVRHPKPLFPVFTFTFSEGET